MKLVFCPNRRPDGRRCRQPLAELRLEGTSAVRIRCPACHAKAVWVAPFGLVSQPSLPLPIAA